MGQMFLDSLISAFSLIVSGDRELWSIVFLSLRCTFLACCAAALTGVPLAFFLVSHVFPGKRLVILHDPNNVNTYRRIRGCAFNAPLKDCRSTYNTDAQQSSHDELLGFRLAFSAQGILP
ncbi:MAG: hypothetical protein LBQ10_05375 [Desulfovibrio sp.]|jgi:hypothetical protein|nr:hypothetical protein [Desulfovibrio sp.]